MKRTISTLIGILIVGAVLADTVGTVTQTTEKIGPVIKNTFTWVGGLTNQSVIATGTVAVRGELLRVVFDPLTSARPTSAYTIYLYDEHGIDLLAGQGASLGTGTVTTIRPGIITTVTPITNIAPFAVSGLLSVTVTNMGAGTKSGKLITYTR